MWKTLSELFNSSQFNHDTTEVIYPRLAITSLQNNLFLVIFAFQTQEVELNKLKMQIIRGTQTTLSFI